MYVHTRTYLYCLELQTPKYEVDGWRDVTVWKGRPFHKNFR